MEYVLPKDLSNQFDVSLQTVYNYLNKHEGSIRTKKELGKTFIHLDDFTKFIQWNSNSFKSPVETTGSNWHSNLEPFLQDRLKEIETENRTLAVQVEDLNKYNNNLNDQVSKYALLLSEEKSEKKDLLSKYDNLQKDYSTKVETLFREKVKIERKYYLLLGILIILLLFFGFFMLNLSRLEKF